MQKCFFTKKQTKHNFVEHFEQRIKQSGNKYLSPREYMNPPIYQYIQPFPNRFEINYEKEYQHPWSNKM
ncbi:hypothetical protein SNEBB_007836, partial [Seison nebaliae]